MTRDRIRRILAAARVTRDRLRLAEAELQRRRGVTYQLAIDLHAAHDQIADLSAQLRTLVEQDPAA